MAHLVRPVRVRYLLDDRRVKKGTKGAKKRSERSPWWHAAGLPGWPRNKRVRLSKSKRTAEQMLAGLVADAERGSVGFISPSTGSQVLADLLPRYADSLAGRDVTADFIRLTLGRLRRALAGAGFVTLADLNASGAAERLEGFLAALRRDHGCGAGTVAHYLSELRSFLRWVRDTAELPVRSLFEGVKVADRKGDPRHPRRELTEAEASALVTAALGSADVVQGLDGRHRGMLYASAIGLGLRLQEFRGLLPGNFQLDRSLPVLVLPPKRTKNRKGGDQPLPPDLAAALREFLSGKPAGRPVWPDGGWCLLRGRGAEMIRHDLEAAGVPYAVVGADGITRFADVHALRHSYVSRVDRVSGGVSVTQKLARHADPR